MEKLHILLLTPAEEDIIRGNVSMMVDGRIWAPYQEFYIQSMLFNCNSAIQSISRVDSVFNKLPEEVTEDDLASLPTHAILNELQNIVIQGAALSRYFWPVRNEHVERGKFLRKTFNVEESSPLKARDLRNAIEHFDERLDRYLANDITGYIFPEFVGSKPTQEGVSGHFFRAYFVDCGIFKLLDGEYDLGILITEIYRISEALQKSAEAKA